MMLTKSVFLASSSELKEDRLEFESFIGRKNSSWVSKGFFLRLVIWEDFLDAMSQTRLQDEYDKAIREADMFVMLFCTKVGKYTEEEFEIAFQQFKATNKPFIFTYFKDIEISAGTPNNQDLISLRAFQEKLRTLGHFQTVYKNIDTLKVHFGQQLDKLAAKGFIKFDPEEDHTAASGSVSTGNINTGTKTNIDTAGGAYVGGHVNTHGGDFVGRNKKVKRPRRAK